MNNALESLVGKAPGCPLRRRFIAIHDFAPKTNEELTQPRSARCRTECRCSKERNALLRPALQCKSGRTANKTRRRLRAGEAATAATLKFPDRRKFPKAPA